MKSSPNGKGSRAMIKWEDLCIQAKHRGVFINCPYNKEFDETYLYIVLTVACCGMYPVAAKDKNNTWHRLNHILELLSLCRYSLHDLTACTGHLNMPLELGAAIMKDWKNNLKDECTWNVLHTESQKFENVFSNLNAGDHLAYDPDANKTVIDEIIKWLSDKNGVWTEVVPSEVWSASKEFKKELARERHRWGPEGIPSRNVGSIAVSVASKLIGKGYIRTRPFSPSDRSGGV